MSDKILIGVPTYDHNIDADCFKAIYGLDKGNNTVLFDYVKGYNAARARSLLALEAHQYKFDYLLFVDSDIILPGHALHSLLKTSKEHHAIAFGWYHRRQYGVDNTETFIWREGERNFGVHNNLICANVMIRADPFRIKGGGLGCTLIPVSVFETIPRPWFEFIDYNRTLTDDPMNTLSEDTAFCTKCENANIELWCDPTVRASHMTSILL